MTYPRSMSVSLAATPYYHVVARCVRRAWLWGVDEYSGKDYSHRKQWILDRLSQPCGVFAIDCATYAVMSNHYITTTSPWAWTRDGLWDGVMPKSSAVTDALRIWVNRFKLPSSPSV